MIYGKIWCVVKPSVGMPMFFVGVALTSLAVHYAVLSNTTWYKKFLNGNAPAATAEVVVPAAVAVAPPEKK